MPKIFLLGKVCLLLLPFFINVCESRRNGNCPWMAKQYKNSTCLTDNFLCFNGKCIERGLFCNGRNDCGDNSDEAHCSMKTDCPTMNQMKLCSPFTKCIPEVWFCDGFKDCINGEDEISCKPLEAEEDSVQFARKKALQWLYSLKKEKVGGISWGKFVEKIAVALHASDSNFTTNNLTRKEMAYEISIQLLSKLYGKTLQDVPSTDLSSFVNAFLVTCLDPRKFHGLDIIEELRARADRENYTNPYVFLTLCNAGDTITESDQKQLIDTFWDERRAFWTDMQAIVVLTLACASKQPGNKVDSKTMQELTLELKQHQYRNGSVENLQTTALVLQALFSAESDDDPENFDEAKAVNQILSGQKPDGSFGSLMNTYFVLPVLNCRSLVNISSDHCHFDQGDETSALEDLTNLPEPKIRVQYSLWIGDDKDLERNIALRVPAGFSFYRIMEIVAEIDKRYNFEYVVKIRKPYITAISGLQNDPEKGKFWFLYKIEEGKPVDSKESPAEVKPKDNDHFVMWYRTEVNHGLTSSSSSRFSI